VLEIELPAARDLLDLELDARLRSHGAENPETLRHDLRTGSIARKRDHMDARHGPVS
jgi:hypothetical protein